MLEAVGSCLQSVCLVNTVQFGQWCWIKHHAERICKHKHDLCCKQCSRAAEALVVTRGKGMTIKIQASMRLGELRVVSYRPNPHYQYAVSQHIASNQSSHHPNSTVDT